MPGTDVHLLSVLEASEEIAARRLSPVELTQAYLERIRGAGAARQRIHHRYR